MSKYRSMTCWVSQRANRFHVFTFIRIQSIHFRSKSKNLMAQKDHCIRICLNSFTFRWTLAVIKVLFFLFCQYRMWNVFRRDGFASNRLSCRIVCLFVFFSPKTWRKLMVLCNISLTCWIIYSPRSMHSAHSLARSLVRAHTNTHTNDEMKKEQNECSRRISQPIIPSNTKSSVMGFCSVPSKFEFA